MTQKTRIKCKDGATHAVTFHDDGRVTSTGCSDLMVEAERIATIVKLGKGIARPNCAGLVALVKYGIASIFSQPGVQNGDELDLGGWRHIYQRFESLKVVEATVKRERRAARRRRRAAAAAAGDRIPEASPEVMDTVDDLLDALPLP